MEFYKRENNNFTAVRMIAAWMVIYAHAYTIQPNGKSDIIVNVSRCTHAGQLSVFIFTFFSGLYIIKSLVENDSVLIFYIKRFMKIYPMLLLSIVFVVVLGALVTTLPLKEYFLHSGTKTYIINNILEIQNEHFLPGVFLEHENSGLNGVLWFITFQVRIYLIMGIFKSMHLFDEKLSSSIILLILIIWSMIRPETMPLIGNNILLYGNEAFPQYVITFGLGGLVYLDFPFLQIKFRHVLFMIILCVLIKDYSLALACWAIMSILFVLWLGTNKIFMKVKVVDCSYEVFLFAWPISQIFREIFPNAGTELNIIFTIIVSTLWGYMLHYTIGAYVKKLSCKIIKNIKEQ